MEHHGEAQKLAQRLTQAHAKKEGKKPQTEARLLKKSPERGLFLLRYRAVSVMP